MNVIVRMLEREDNLIMPPNPFITTNGIMVIDETRINASKQATKISSTRVRSHLKIKVKGEIGPFIIMICIFNLGG